MGKYYGMVRIFILLPFFVLMNTFFAAAQDNQIKVPRVELMPNEPAPYSMRDWKVVAMKYDSFAYNVNKTGQYLPLITVKPNGNNYPGNKFFSMQTYVGSNNTANNEAINSLPSLVGATLVGIDKSNQFGQNWVLMSQDFFNKKNGNNIYLNGNSTDSGHDWWYDMMPNVFFYQLADLYSNIGGEKDTQYRMIADRMLTSVKAMGGSDRPWSAPNMNYRAWDFKNMTPLEEGVKEPEAAGAYAWLLYNAYLTTGEREYLKGAALSLDFLQNLTSNPSYELQLPYGTYIAARMNAELGTGYDIEKMVNWSFNRGSLRGWGTIVGKWGGFDVSGLVGEANDGGNDYAFQLNGIQQAAMLVPMVRYDKRFARAVGKWVLNLANATRLFYPGFLPASLQDGSDWAGQYDADRVIGYEALREKWNGNSPYSTGDAVKGGWAGTNLSLYSTSSIGYLGAIIEKSDVDKILRLNLNKTDFYQKKSYPSYLYFNPFNTDKEVTISLGGDLKDVYDAVSENWLAEGKSGDIKIPIPANSAIIAVIAPAGGEREHNGNKFTIDGIVVDYDQHALPYTYAPTILSVAPQKDTVEFGKTVQVFSKVIDKDSQDLTYKWSSSTGEIIGQGAQISWIAPVQEGSSTITLIVSDESGNRDSLSTAVFTIHEINVEPQIIELTYSSLYTISDGIIDLIAVAEDANGDILNYQWSANGGSFSNASNASTQWKAPGTEGVYDISVKVTDPGGLSAQVSKSILVRTFTEAAGDLVAWYPFSGNALDSTDYHHDGIVSGALFVADVWGRSKSALRFDGVNDKVTINSTNALNFQDGITLSCWIRPGALSDRESFVVSHGSWQNRWKLSITPEGFPRWTVNSSAGIVDVDADRPIKQDSVYQVTATYDGKDMIVYINGQLVSFKPLTGKIRQTNIPVTIGQMTPDEVNYNFAGLIDEVRIYDYALTPEQAGDLYTNYTSATSNPDFGIQNLSIFPNPGHDVVSMLIPHSGVNKLLEIFDTNGRKVKIVRLSKEGLVNVDLSEMMSGQYFLRLKTERGVMIGKWSKL